MTVTPTAVATRGSVTPCSSCGVPSRSYSTGCKTCTDRRRQHRRRDKLRAEREAERAADVSGRLLVVSSGGDVGRIVWRPTKDCTRAKLASMVDGMRRRKNDPELEIVRNIECGMVLGYRIRDAAGKYRDDSDGDSDGNGEWHDLESVREQLDKLDPVPERVVWEQAPDYTWATTWGGRSFVLVQQPDHFALMEQESGDIRYSDSIVKTSVHLALAWARLCVRAGWPHVSTVGG